MKKDIKRCIRCILPSHYPRIIFDSEGICSYCRAYEHRWKNWNESEGEMEFLKLIKWARKRNPKYSALVGISGGKDSSYTIHMLVKKYKLNVLAFTYDNGFFSEDAKRNIDRIVKKLNVEHRYMSTDREVEKRMYRSLLKKKCADFCQICMLGSISASNYLAIKEDIPLVVWGVSPRTDPIQPLELFLGNDYKYLVDVMEPEVRSSEYPLFKYAGIPKVFYSTFIKRSRLVFFPQYVEWDEKKITELLQEQYGWIDYGNGTSHFDCVANPAFDFFTNQRLGVSKVIEKLSQLVRCGQLTRQDALKKLELQDHVEEPVESISEICRRLEIKREDLKYLLEGKALDYHHFKTYSKFLERFSWLFWITYKLGFTTESLYRKYSWR